MNRRHFIKYFLSGLSLLLINFSISKKIIKKNEKKFVVNNWSLKSEDLT